MTAIQDEDCHSKLCERLQEPCRVAAGLTNPIQSKPIRQPSILLALIGGCVLTTPHRARHIPSQFRSIGHLVSKCRPRQHTCFEELNQGIHCHICIGAGDGPAQQMIMLGKSYLQPLLHGQIYASTCRWAVAGAGASKLACHGFLRPCKVTFA